jgi:hypothetical protein
MMSLSHRCSALNSTFSGCVRWDAVDSGAKLKYEGHSVDARADPVESVASSIRA